MVLQAVFTVYVSFGGAGIGVAEVFLDDDERGAAFDGESSAGVAE